MEAKIATYWIVNVNDGQIEVLTEPTGPGPAPTYLNQVIVDREGDVPFVLDGVEVARIAARDLLP